MKKIRHILLIFILIQLICQLYTVNCKLLYAQDTFLGVKGRTRINNLQFDGSTSVYPATPVEGELFYRSDLNFLKYFDGREWRDFGAGPKTIASQFVASSTSPNSAGADFVCDGTSDQVEIQSAINALAATGGAVYLSEGAFNISGSINITGTNPNITIVGAGKGTILNVVTAGVNVFDVGSQVSGIIIEQLCIDGNSTAGAGIRFTRVTDSAIDNVWIQDIADGVRLRSSSNNTLTNSHFVNSCIYLEESTAGVFTQFNAISNNSLQGSASNALILVYKANNNIISGNNVQQNTSAAGILVQNGGNNIIIDNNIYNNSQEGIFLTSASASGVARFTVISGNSIWGNQRAGIRLDRGNVAWPGARDNLISSNSIYNNGAGGAYDGINLAADNDRNLIAFNRLEDSSGTGYGINIAAATSEENYLVENLIDGLGYASRLVYDLGTNTRYTDKLKLAFEKIEINPTNWANFYFTDPDAINRLHLTTYPVTFAVINMNYDIVLTNALENGRAPGDILIILNASTKFLRFQDCANIEIEGTGQLNLYQYDSIKFIWNGAKWLEMETVNIP